HTGKPAGGKSRSFRCWVRGGAAFSAIALTAVLALSGSSAAQMAQPATRGAAPDCERTWANPFTWFQDCAQQSVVLQVAADSPLQQQINDGESPFGDLQGLEAIYRKAAGFNGNPVYQYLLGEIFRFDSTKANPAAAYFWYMLAYYNPRTQNNPKVFDVVQRNFPDVNNEVQPNYKSVARTAFEAVYLHGGAEAFYHLGVLYKEGNFGSTESENYDEPNIYAYAWLTLAKEFGYTQAEEEITTIQLSELNTKLATLLAEEYRQKVVKIQQSGNFPGGSPQTGFPGGGYGNDGSHSPHPGLPGTDASPNNALGAALNRGDWFQARRNPIEPDNSARTWLQVGRAYLSAGEVAQARTAFNTAILIDSSSPAALDAQRHLQSLTTTCAYVSRYEKVKLSDGTYVEAKHPDASLNYEIDPVFGFEPALNSLDQVDLKVRQRALKALGHYTGPIDGLAGPGTRRAVRDFQRSLSVNETGHLSKEQSIKLLCNAAQNAEHADSQNILGILYLSGVGLKQDFDLGHYWLSRAAEKHHASALFNLGLLYQQGMEGQSLPLSDSGQPMVNPKTGQLVRYYPHGKGVNRDLQMAKQYFFEAKEYGHPKAAKMINKIKAELRKPVKNRQKKNRKSRKKK
ncbi:MAG: peptidoglycan-binding protein, partial [Alphaproteobacteria bacterium]